MPPKKEKKKKEASTFLESVYGEEGEGPDADLIKMLERDIVVRNPNVKFDDIAELDDAKKVLWESTVLPLIYPQFFTVRVAQDLGYPESLQRSDAVRSTWHWEDDAGEGIGDDGEDDVLQCVSCFSGVEMERR